MFVFFFLQDFLAAVSHDAESLPPLSEQLPELEKIVKHKYVIS